MDISLPELEKLKNQLNSSQVPPDLKEKTNSIIERLGLNLKFGYNILAIDQVAKYINWITQLPWTTSSEDRLDLKIVQDLLNRSHYGLNEIKERILEYIAVLKLLKTNNDKNYFRAPILCFVGLAGTGKTTIAMAIAESLNRKFVRIPLGGMGSSLELRGLSQAQVNAEPGQVIKALRRVQHKNPVILLDEIDRVTEEARADIMGVLLELLDPEQNNAFSDNYIDYPFDLSQVIFVTTANNTNNISTAVLDRLEPLQMPSYSDIEKIEIGKKYMLPKVMAQMGLKPENLTVDESVWPIIVRPLGFDSGIRSLERTISQICRKVARLIVEGKSSSFHINSDNIKDYIQTW